MTGIRRHAQKWNFLIYFMVLCFLSSVVDVQPAFAAKTKAKLKYDLLDDSIDYEWMKGEEDIVYRLEFTMDKKFKDYWLVAQKRVKKKVLSKVKAKFQKKIARYNRNYEKEKQAFENSSLGEKKIKKGIQRLMKTYVGQVRSDLLTIKSQNDDEVIEFIEKEMMAYLKVKDPKGYDKAKKKRLALKITLISVGAALVVVGAAAAIAATILSGGTALIVLGIVGAAAGAIAGGVATVEALYQTIKKYNEGTFATIEATRDTFDDFKKIAGKTRDLPDNLSFRNPDVKKWKKDLFKSHKALSKNASAFSKRVVKLTKYYTKADNQVEKLAKKIRKLKKGGNAKEEKHRVKMLEKLDSLDKVTDNQLEQVHKMVKVSGRINESIKSIHKKLKPLELKKNLKDAVRDIDSALTKFERYVERSRTSLSDTERTVDQLSNVVEDAQEN